LLKKGISMNSPGKVLRFFVVFFSVLFCISFSFDGTNCYQIKLSGFIHETGEINYSNKRRHNDFSYDGKWDNFNDRGSPGNTGDFDSYTKEDFQYLCECGYTETELLNQRGLYMSNEFVQYAQTCSGYKDAIQKLYAELKSINLIQKVYRAAKGTYCKGLQDRIAYLYKQLNTVKAIPQDNNGYYTPHSDKPSFATKAASFDRIAFSEQFAEYKLLEPIYDAYVPCLAKAINARSDIYQNIVAGECASASVKKLYNLNNNIKKLLSRYGHEFTPFVHCSGNQLQQVIHQESLNILDRVESLPKSSILYDHQETLVDFTAAMIDYNHGGLTDKAMSIGDLCWMLLDYGQAIAEGAALGVYSAAHDILTNPIEATVSIVAGKQILAYQLCKVLYNVADIGATAISDYDRAKDKWNKYAEPLNNIIDAINKKEITVRDAIKGGTAFVVGYKAQGKLLGGLSKFCTTIKHKSISFVQNNPLLNPQEYLTTPEGVLFKTTIECMKNAQDKVMNGLPIPQFIKDDRVPLDKETVLISALFKKTKIPSVKGARVYIKDNLFYHRDTFHTGQSAHLEVYNKRGIHLGEADIFTGIIRADTADKTKTLYL
jgi:hypothetical protein